METVREIARGDDQWLMYDQKLRNTKCQLRVSRANKYRQLLLKAMYKTPDFTEEASTYTREL